MGNNIKNCLECQKNQFWVEIRLVDELNKPFGSLTGTLKDASGNMHAVTLTGGYLLLTDLPAGPVELKLETKALLTEAKKHKPRPMPQTSPAKEYTDKNKGYRKSKMKYQYITLGDVWTFEPQIIPDRHRPGSAGQPLRMATNNSYVLEIKSLAQITLPALIHKTPDAGHYMDDYTVADDMQHGDLSKSMIMEIVPTIPERFFSDSAEIHFRRMIARCSIYSWYGDYSSLGETMINRFKQNKTGKFSHSLLNKALHDHENTNDTVEKIKIMIKNKLTKNNYEMENEGLDQVFNDLAFGKNKIIHAGFNKKEDYINGLVLSVHTLWCMEIRLTKLDVDLVDKKFRGLIEIVAQDHFGLDKKDITAGSKVAQSDAMFKSWFMLQRWSEFNYKPFITEMIIVREINGDL